MHTAGGCGGWAEPDGADKPAAARQQQASPKLPHPCTQVWLYMQRLVYIDAADVFKQLKRIKRRRTIVFGAYAVSMVLIVYM